MRLCTPPSIATGSGSVLPPDVRCSVSYRSRLTPYDSCALLHASDRSFRTRPRNESDVKPLFDVLASRRSGVSLDPTEIQQSRFGRSCSRPFRVPAISTRVYLQKLNMAVACQQERSKTEKRRCPCPIVRHTTAHPKN